MRNVRALVALLCASAAGLPTPSFADRPAHPVAQTPTQFDNELTVWVIPAPRPAELSWRTPGGLIRRVVTNAVGSVVSLEAVLRVLVSPSLLAISRVNGVVSVEVRTVAGLSYTLEFTEAFTVSQGSPAQGWNALGTVAGTGGTVVLTDTGAGAGSRFYRVRVE